MSRLLWAIFATLIILSVPSAQRKADALQSRNRSSLASNRAPSMACRDESNGIRTSLQQFSSGEYVPIKEARKLLLDYAKKSPACRRKIIGELVDSMDTHDLNFERQPSSYYLWREGSQLLGEMKAIEALDLLISHLDLTDGYHSASMVFQPAVVGVRQMGPAAVPKLAIALRESPRISVRMAAVHCLTDIGGLAAMHVLEQAQASETSNCVSHFISVSLTTYRYTSKFGRVLFSSGALQANTKVRQDWLTASECVE